MMVHWCVENREGRRSLQHDTARAIEARLAWWPYQILEAFSPSMLADMPTNVKAAAMRIVDAEPWIPMEAFRRQVLDFLEGLRLEQHQSDEDDTP